ncbi:aldehyde dehydrogenase family protein [Mycobacterium kyogaense]|uniref:aldehyde dehydrogenase family protein n=1 Tax=Mycobacterium kyogaense TaxID=2212479 RepID=UPI00308413F1
MIDGQLVDASDGGTSISRNPATKGILAEFAEATAADVDSAVAAARRAFEAGVWRAMSNDERGRVLWRVAELLERHQDELATMETLDQGQPLAMSREVNVPMAAQVFRYYAGWATKIEGKVSAVSAPNALHYTRREPVGVCALITPWNMPLAIAAWKIAPALAAGNTVVVKPAEQTPFTTVRLVQLCLEAGVPPGVVNVLTGGPDVGQALVAHTDVDKVSFTGSTEVGQQIGAVSAQTNLKKVSLELGGKAPSIITPEADIDAAVVGNLQGALFNTGQACGAYTRFFVHRTKADEFVSKISDAARSITIGPGMLEGNDLGPLISGEHLQRVTGYIDSGVEAGAELVLDGRLPKGDHLDEGWYLGPTVFTGVSDDMAIAQEEIFGPVLSIMTYDDIDEAVVRANDSRFGLAAVVWTRDLVVAHTLTERLRAGTVFVNQLPLIDPAGCWGGIGMSGWGREMGSFAIDEFTETKGVWIRTG